MIQTLIIRTIGFFFFLSGLAVFGQNTVKLTSSKPFNKGNFVLNLGYESHRYGGYGMTTPKCCFEVGYGFFDWCVAGLYSEYGSHESMTAYGQDQMHVYNEHFVFYGLHNELHPIAVFLPSFYFVDLYTIIRVGMFHKVVRFEEKDLPQDYYVGHSNASEAYCSGGWGIALNPSRYFGLFYERTYTSLGQNTHGVSEGGKHHLYHRFGLNVRFGGPRKWQRSGQ